ncbi:unnamed protein product [Paramecium primaurelia]|uniref:TmcB/TmcC TPR repeats domain-containing protein n=1 Tax=Paramecium primaurelia TaxID=5886 RepID=A0A8S1M8G4_PARPR|nr:unnamed protein product [Paramecium primaurelia]
METKSEYGLSKEGQSSLGKVVVEIKNVLFQVTRQMLIDDDPSLLFTIASLFIQLFQMTYICFNRNLYQAWKHDDIAKYVNQITGYVLLSPQYDQMQYSAMVILTYLFVGIIALEILLYLVLSNRTEKLSKTLPMTMLKSIINLMLSILYMPIVDLFISVWTCKDSYHFSFTNYECWTGSHTVHSIVAIIFLIIFYILSAIHSFLYYEARFIYTNSLSKQSGFDDFILKTYIVIQVLNYSFIESQYVQIILIAFGNITLYIYNYHQNTHNNLYVYKMWQMIIAINNWTCIMLAFSKILEDVIFRGTIYAWLLGIPLLIIIVIQNPEERIDLLLLDNLKGTISQILLQQHHLLRLHNWNSQLFNIILDGYLKTHNQTCIRPDCGKELIKIIQQNYLDASKRFPYDYQLKIRYGFFLLHIGQRQYALQEFNQAQNLNPTMDYEFVLFRYKKIIEDEMNDQNVEQIDTHNEAMYLNIIKNFQSKIERVTLINMDFWSQLQEDYPDLGKLNQIGLNIHNLMNEIDMIWNRLQKTKQNTQKSLKMYSKFMIDVVQDQEYGELLYEKSRVMDASYIRKGIQMASKEEISMESLPTMIISLAQDKFGQIINLNTACHVFGYMKNELVNRKLNVLIPNIFQKAHDQLMKLGFDQKLMKERSIYVKNKQNYLIPCIIEMKSLTSLDQSVMIIAQFKLFKPYKQTCYILFDSDDIIDSISFNCISLLGLDLRLIQNKKLLVSEIFPQLQDKSEFLIKGGGIIQYKIPEDIMSGQIQSNEYIDEKTKLSQEFICTLNSVTLNNQQLGYMMKLEQKENENRLVPLKKQKSNFQFKYNVGKKIFLGEFSTDQVSAIHDLSSVHDQTVDVSAMSIKNQSITQVKSSEDQKFDYGEGIKTLQLFQNRIQEIDKEEIMEEFDEEHQQSVFQNNIEQQQENESNINNNIFKSRASLQEQIKNQGRISIIQKMIWFTNILYLVMTSLAFFEFFYLNQQYNEIEENINLIGKENQIHATLQTILTNVQNLKMLNLGVWQNANASTYEKTQKEALIKQLNNVQDLNKEVLMSELKITDIYSNLKVSDAVKMYFSTSQSQQYDFMEATQQIISKGIEVSNLPLREITEEQSSVFFVEYNLLNDYWIALSTVSDQFVLALDDRTTRQEKVEIIIITLSAIMLFMSLIIYSIAIILLAQMRLSILQLFLDIPEKTVKYFYSKCENYISNLQVGEDDENVSFQEDLEEQAELNKTLKSRKKKKKFINSNQNHKDHILLFVFSVMLLQGYFIFTYFVTQNELNNMNQQIAEFNITTRCEGFYRFCDNSERQLFYNQEIQLLNQKPYEVIKQNVKDMYAYDTSMQQQHALNIDVQNSDYRSVYDHIMMSDPCDVLPSYGSPDTVTCQAFARGALAQGNSIGVARYIENLRYIITIYDKFIGLGSKPNFTTVARGDAVYFKIVDDPEKNNILNLNNFNQTKEARTYQSNYLTPSFRYLTDNMIDGFSSDLSDHVAQKLAVFIVFNVVLFIMQFLIMYPFLLKLNKQISNTRLLLTMIPLRLILKIYSIRNFIKNNLTDIQY